jgi:hypothetical protein
VVGGLVTSLVVVIVFRPINDGKRIKPQRLRTVEEIFLCLCRAGRDVGRQVLHCSSMFSARCSHHVPQSTHGEADQRPVQETNQVANFYKTVRFMETRKSAHEA